MKIVCKPVGAKNHERDACTDEKQFDLPIGNLFIGIDANGGLEHDFNPSIGCCLNDRLEIFHSVRVPARQQDERTINSIEGGLVARVLPLSNCNAAIEGHHSGVPSWQTVVVSRILNVYEGGVMLTLRMALVGMAVSTLPMWSSSQSVAAETPPPNSDTNQPRQLEEFKPLRGLDNTPKGGTLPGGTLPGGTLPGGTLPGGTLPGGTLPGGTLPGGTLPGGTVPGGTLPGGTVPGGTLPGGTLAGGPL